MRRYRYMPLACTLLWSAIFFSGRLLSAEPVAKIPSNLQETYAWLDVHLAKEDVEKIRNGGDTSFMRPLAMLLRNTWKLSAGSPLREIFVQRGIKNSERMSSVVLNTYVDHVRGKPIRVEEVIGWYAEAEKVAIPPPNMNCPNCSVLLEHQGYTGDLTPDGRPRCIHFGFCTKEGQLWFFEHGRDWYRPQKEKADSLIRDLKEAYAWDE